MLWKLEQEIEESGEDSLGEANMWLCNKMTRTSWSLLDLGDLHEPVLDLIQNILNCGK